MTIDMHQLVDFEGDDDRLDAIIELISSLTDADVLKGDVLNDLYELSSGTIFEGIEPNPEGVFLVRDTNKFEASATIYVTLQYGGSRDGVTMSDSYPAYVTGHFNDKVPEIDTISVDTSSFYE
jgi:hypothetical protein